MLPRPTVSSLSLLRTALVIGSAAALFGASARCSPGVGVGSTLAFNGSHFTVAWADKQGIGTNVIVGQFTNLAQDTQPEVVMQALDVTAAPEIVWTGDGYWVIANRGDQGIGAVRVSEAGKAEGPVLDITDDPAVLCASPVWTGGRLVLGFATLADDGDLVYALLQLDPAGQAGQTGQAVMPASAVVVAEGPASDLDDASCATSAATNGIAVAAVFNDDHAEDEGGQVLALAYLRDDGHLEAIHVDQAERLRARTMSHAAGRHSVTYLRNGEPVQARVSAHDVETRSMIGVDAKTFDLVDLGAGYAAAWRDGGDGDVVIATFDDAHSETGRAELERPAGSAIRMGTDGTRCAATWTEMDGHYVLLLVRRDCAASSGADLLQAVVPAE